MLLNASDTFRSTYIAKITYGCDMSIHTAKHKDSFLCEDKRSKHGYISGTIYDRKVYFVPN